MRKIPIFLLLLLAACNSGQKDKTQKAEQPKMIATDAQMEAYKIVARDVSTAWLKVLDVGKYEDAYDQVSAFMKSQATKDQWKDFSNQVASSFGKNLNREFISADYYESGPTAGNHQYVVCKFKSDYELKKQTVETVSVLLEKDMGWRVMGYFLDPVQAK